MISIISGQGKSRGTNYMNNRTPCPPHCDSIHILLQHIITIYESDGRTAPVSRGKELDALPSLEPSIAAATPCERAALQVSSLGSSPPRSSTIYRLRGLCRTRKGRSRGDQLRIRIGFPWRDGAIGIAVESAQGSHSS
ncbi:unnamed protein product [Musa hybrid cultivar]